MHLTKRYADAAKYRGTCNGRDIRWDDDPKGLGLRIYPSGRKAFVVSYRNANSVKRMKTLQDFGVLTLEEARKRAKRLLVSIGDNADPVAEARLQRLEAKRCSTSSNVTGRVRHAPPKNCLVGRGMQ